MDTVHVLRSPDSDPRTLPLLQRYLSASGTTLETVLIPKHAHDFFRAVVKDFLLYRLSPDELSLVLSKLWWIISVDPVMEREPVTEACAAAAEMEWFMRNDPVAGGEYLWDVLAYYEEIGGKTPRQPKESRYPDHDHHA
jgi:hypothetical protein